MGLVKNHAVSPDLNRVENETTIFPILIEIKNIKRTTIIKRCRRKDPILTVSRRYPTVLLVKIKNPTAKTRYITEMPVLLNKDAKVTGVFIFMNRISLYFRISRIFFI